MPLSTPLSKRLGIGHRLVTDAPSAREVVERIVREASALLDGAPQRWCAA